MHAPRRGRAQRIVSILNPEASGRGGEARADHRARIAHARQRNRSAERQFERPHRADERSGQPCRDGNGHECRAAMLRGRIHRTVPSTLARGA